MSWGLDLVTRPTCKVTSLLMHGTNNDLWLQQLYNQWLLSFM